MPSLLAKPNEFLLVCFLLLLFLSHTPTTTAQPLYKVCISTASYSTNSTFGNNLHLLLSSLSSNATDNGFYNTSIGESPNQVSGIALCRGDTTPVQCYNCLSTASQEILICPKRTAYVWYDFCFLRYSNRIISPSYDDSIVFYMWNTQNAPDPDQFNRTLNEMMRGLTVTVAFRSPVTMYATNSTRITGNQTLYGLMQCTRDLSANDCYRCLDDAVGQIPMCCDGKLGGRVIGVNCNLRYEVYKFYNDLAAAPPPPTPVLAPPPTNTTTAGMFQCS